MANKNDIVLLSFKLLDKLFYVLVMLVLLFECEYSGIIYYEYKYNFTSGTTDYTIVGIGDTGYSTDLSIYKINGLTRNKSNQASVQVSSTFLLTVIIFNFITLVFLYTIMQYVIIFKKHDNQRTPFTEKMVWKYGFIIGISILVFLNILSPILKLVDDEKYFSDTIVPYYEDTVGYTFSRMSTYIFYGWLLMFGLCIPWVLIIIFYIPKIFGTQMEGGVSAQEMDAYEKAGSIDVGISINVAQQLENSTVGSGGDDAKIAIEEAGLANVNANGNNKPVGERNESVIDDVLDNQPLNNNNNNNNNSNNNQTKQYVAEGQSDSSSSSETNGGNDDYYNYGNENQNGGNKDYENDRNGDNVNYNVNKKQKDESDKINAVQNDGQEIDTPGFVDIETDQGDHGHENDNGGDPKIEELHAPQDMEDNKENEKKQKRKSPPPPPRPKQNGAAGQGKKVSGSTKRGPPGGILV